MALWGLTHFAYLFLSLDLLDDPHVSVASSEHDSHSYVDIEPHALIGKFGIQMFLVWISFNRIVSRTFFVKKKNPQN